MGQAMPSTDVILPWQVVLLQMWDKNKRMTPFSEKGIQRASLVSLCPVPVQVHLRPCPQPMEESVLCERTSQNSLSSPNVRQPVRGKPEKGSFRFLFFTICHFFWTAWVALKVSGTVPRSMAPARQNLHLPECWLTAREREFSLEAAIWGRYYLSVQAVERIPGRRALLCW